MDYDPPSPLEQYLTRKKTILLVVLSAILLLALYYFIFVNQYVVAYRDDVDHFKHGSIGSEVANGLPYWVFKALPVMYRDELGPGGFRKFGLLYEKESDDLPIGFSRRIVDGVERVWLNCSVCHMGTYRLGPGQPVNYIPGAPSNALRLQDVSKFFLHVGADPGFTADSLIAAINSPEVGGNLNVVERLIYRAIVYPRVKEALLGLSSQLGFVYRQKDWGPGRVDTFNPYKTVQFGYKLDPANITEEELNGSADYPSIWRQRPREGMFLHWDGNNDSVDERNLSAALGAGVTPTTVDRAAIFRVKDWIWDLPAPPFPDRAAIDQKLVPRGHELYAEYCASCHGIRDIDADSAGGAKSYSASLTYANAPSYSYDTNRFPALGRVTPLAEIGTDRGRWASYTQNFAASQNTLYAGYPWRFSHFRKTNGYSNQPLDGVWARSPYLHNGSVPTLRDLLEPAAKRPALWWRGSDILDLRKVGYRSDADSGGEGELFRYDVRDPGNSNAGHEYGAHLPDADKDAIVEYMKTL